MCALTNRKQRLTKQQFTCFCILPGRTETLISLGKFVDGSDRQAFPEKKVKINNLINKLYRSLVALN